MANRSFHQPLGNLEVDVVNLWVEFTVGATGAPTLVSAPGSKGITSVTRNAAGKYTILLQDTYAAFLNASFCLVDSTATLDPSTVGVNCRLLSQAVSNATPTVVIQFYAFDDGVAADVTSGGRVQGCITVRNSTLV